MSRKLKVFSAAIFFLTLLSACVTPPVLDEQVPSLAYAGSEKIAIAVDDQRESVREGKPKNYVGYSRTSLGIPISHTLNKMASVEGDKNRTMVQYLAHRLDIGLSTSGWDVAVIELPEDGADAGIDLDRKVLILKLNEWYY